MMHIEELCQRMSTDVSVVKVTPNFVTRKKDRAFLSCDGSCRGQHGQEIRALDSQSSDPRVDSLSGHLLDLFSVFPSSNLRPCL